MSNTKKHQSGMWEYLDSTGVLEWGNDEAIKKAKKAYRKIYFTKQKRKQRAVKREFTIRFSKENGEFIKIAHEAKQHNLKITEFLKSAVMAYINQTFVIPDHWQVAELELLLSQCLNEIQTIVKQKERYSFDREYKYELIEKRIEKLESEIHLVLKNPYTIEEIVIRGIEEKPSLKEQLLTILTNHKNDYQNQIT
ncbi:MAG: hypothetical protein HXX18_09295 [Bacteroidetes bacterium]|nr:hypothetical protein [Bacteroidota bacterium]